MEGLQRRTFRPRRCRWRGRGRGRGRRARRRQPPPRGGWRRRRRRRGLGGGAERQIQAGWLGRAWAGGERRRARAWRQDEVLDGPGGCECAAPPPSALPSSAPRLGALLLPDPYGAVQRAAHQLAASHSGPVGGCSGCAGTDCDGCHLRPVSAQLHVRQPAASTVSAHAVGQRARRGGGRRRTCRGARASRCRARRAARPP